jgi:hypothetical protein
VLNRLPQTPHLYGLSPIATAYISIDDIFDGM